MNLNNLIVPMMRNATEQVLAAMLGIEIGPPKASIERTAPEPTDGVVAFIEIAGAWAGAGSLSCSAALACRLCELMLGTESPAGNEEVLDAVGELTNMIIGNVKTDLEPYIGQLGLSTPTAIIGGSFRTKRARNTQWSVLQYELEGETLTLKLCLAPQKTCSFSQVSSVAPGGRATG